MLRDIDIFISAGEASGEAYGAQLIEALRRMVDLSHSSVRFFGLGGPAMEEAGCDLVAESGDVAVVGLAEVVKHLPRIYARYRALVRQIDGRKPSAAVLIDFPDFNFRLARQLHKRGIPVIYFVSPQLWAWRSERIQLVRRHVSKMLVIFPFEEQWYRSQGVEAEYVGHPLADVTAGSSGGIGDRKSYAKKLGLDPSQSWIALLPGSRKGEIERNLDPMLEAAERLGDLFQFVIPVAPTIDRAWLTKEIAGHRGGAIARTWLLTDNAREALGHARAAVIASGTATVEAALMGTPFVAVYRLSGLTWSLGRRLVTVDRFAMPNLIAGRQIVPELIQHNFTSENVLAELGKILPDGIEREKMLSGLLEVRTKLKPAESPAVERAAKAVLELVKAS